MKLYSIVIITSLIMTSCCCIVQQDRANMGKSDMIYDQQVHAFEEIPKFLCDNIDNMGTDKDSVLNVLEGGYLNSIFNVNPQVYNLIGKRICFLQSGSLKTKEDYFSETRNRYKHMSSIIGGSTLYIFNEAQRKESGGAYAAIVYWSKFAISIDDILKRLNRSIVR